MIGRLLVGSILAATLLGAVSAQAIDEPDARHLLLRTGFGASPEAVAALRPLDRRAAVARILDGVRVEAATPPPVFVRGLRPDWQTHWKEPDETIKQTFNRARDAEIVELKAWWYAEMITTPSPLTERMTLFWHNHFTSSMDKVRAPDLLHTQNALLRRHATGSFRDILHAVAKDPAMVKYLDNTQNKKGAAVENFARELLELFTLGEGHYGETDIREAARAFSGWQVDERTGVFRFNAREHDDGAKTVLGVKGPLKGEDVLDIILKQPRTAEFIAGKLVREFLSETPDAGLVTRVATRFRDTNYSIRAALQTIFDSDAFWAAETRGILIKSPVDLVVGTIRTLDLPIADLRSLIEPGRRMRQDIFNPPNVRGWPGGTNWISTFTLIERRSALAKILNNDMGPLQNSMTMMMASDATTGPAWSARGRGLDAWLSNHPNIAAAAGPMEMALLSVQAVNGTDADVDSRAMIERLVLDPAYQMK
ncbi:MAG: DUF1800 domain-containing protein [Rhodospirillales bacterium]|nr:DUF1800 domain-containing protein [Rhodospirillales bacterium]